MNVLYKNSPYRRKEKLYKKFNITIPNIRHDVCTDQTKLVLSTAMIFFMSFKYFFYWDFKKKDHMQILKQFIRMLKCQIRKLIQN